MKKFPFALLLATLAASAYAQSTTPGVSDADKSNLPTGASPSVSDADRSNLATGSGGDARTFKALLSSRNCVVDTGTHIVRKGACINTTGRSYDITDIEHTGTFNTGVALERLDPAITIRAP